MPKTAGTTLNSILDQSFAGQNRYSYHGSAIQNFHAMSDVERQEIDLLFGHTPFGIHRHLRAEYTYVFLLRSPVDRIFSYYNYLSVREDHPAFARVGGAGINFGSFLRLCVDDKDLGNDVDNAQVQLLAGTFGGRSCSAATLQGACRLLFENSTIFGLNELFPNFLEHLVEKKIISTYENRRENESGKKVSLNIELHKLDARERKILHEFVLWDQALYDIAKKYELARISQRNTKN